MKRLLLMVLLIAFCSSCQDTPYPGKPEDVYKEMVNAMAEGNIRKASLYIAKEKRNGIMEIQGDPNSVEYSAAFFRTIDWSVTNSNILDDSATVDIRIRQPNLGKLYGIDMADLFSGTTETRAKSNTEKKIHDNVMNKLKSGDFDYLDSMERLYFVREGDKWKFLKSESLGAWKKISEAMQLYGDGHYNDAKKLFEEALSNDPDDAAKEVANNFIRIIETRLEQSGELN